MNIINEIKWAWEVPQKMTACSPGSL